MGALADLRLTEALRVHSEMKFGMEGGGQAALKAMLGISDGKERLDAQDLKALIGHVAGKCPPTRMRPNECRLSTSSGQL